MVTRVCVLVAIMLAVTIVGCSDDDTPTAPAPKATVVVDTTPDGINCPWQLTGPNSYSHNGQDNETLSNLTPGDYTLTWGDLAGWNLPVPDSETKTVADGGTVTFSGTYIQQLGTITVDAEPNSINAPWQLTGPSSYNHNGTGDETLSDLTPGDYTLTWGAVSGYDSPDPASRTRTLTGDGTTAFTGTYVPEAGTVALRLTNVDAVTTGYVRIADNPGLEPQVFTIEAWITPKGPGYGQTTDEFGGTVIGKNTEGTAGFWLWSWTLNWTSHDSSATFSVVNQFKQSGVSIKTSNSAVPLNATTHIAAVFDGANLSLYVDGALEVTEPYPYAGVYYGDEDVLIGGANYLAPHLRRFDGIVDEVRLWDHARTVGQITANKDCALSGNEAGLLAYWGFESGFLTDDSGNGHDGMADATGASVTFVDPLVSLRPCP